MGIFSSIGGALSSIFGGSKPKVDTSALNFQKKLAGEARKEEEQRKLRLAFGQSQIDAIFGGGTAFDTVGSFDSGQGASTTFPGFDALVDRRRQAGLDVALPQLDKRFGDARSGLAFNLSRAGLSNSSQAAGRQAELGEVFQLQGANIRAGVEVDVASLRSRISQAKSDAELQLRATSDPSSWVNTALASRTRFAGEQPSGFTLGDVFAMALSGIGQGVNTFQANKTAETLSRLLASSTTKGSGRVVN